MFGTRLVRLEPFDERRHFEDYFEVRSDPALLAYWTHRRRVLSRNQVEDELRGDLGAGGRHVFLAVLSRFDGAVRGFVWSYGYNPEWGFAYVTCVLKRRFVRTGVGVHAMAVFVPYLFEQFPVRKLYAEQYAGNGFSEAILPRVGFALEGRLREHAYCPQGFRDLLLWALHRHDLGAALRWRERLSRPENLAGEKQDVIATGAENT